MPEHRVVLSWHDDELLGTRQFKFSFYVNGVAVTKRGMLFWHQLATADRFATEQDYRLWYEMLYNTLYDDKAVPDIEEWFKTVSIPGHCYSTRQLLRGKELLAVLLKRTAGDRPISEVRHAEP